MSYEPPSREDSFDFPAAYKEGRIAYPSMNNPYTEGTEEHNDWEVGWWDEQGYQDFIEGNIK